MVWIFYLPTLTPSRNCAARSMVNLVYNQASLVPQGKKQNVYRGILYQKIRIIFSLDVKFKLEITTQVKPLNAVPVNKVKTKQNTH